MKGMKLKSLIVFSVIAMALCTSCKKTENPNNDAANKEAGSFDDNHAQSAVDTTGPATDSITSNSTQTDPTAVEGNK